MEGIPKTQCLLDDIFVAGAEEEEHLKLLEEVLERLSRYHLTINKGKYAFFQREVTYCGYRVDGEGLHKTAEKVQSVMEAPQPSNVSQLHAFLGMVNYYHRFLPNLSTTLTPLHHLLKKHIKWAWSPECEAAFNKVKQLMASDTVLTHFNPGVPLVLSCDASPYGLGAVLSHTMPDGGERPVVYVSRTLTPAECNYAQIDKEALAVTWGVKKFHQYLYGLHFTLITDHQPLTALFSPDRSISATAASRLQRQALFLSAYTYTIRYRSTDQHANADALSRLPSGQQDQTPGDDEEDITTYLVQQIELLPVTALSLR